MRERGPRPGRAAGLRRGTLRALRARGAGLLLAAVAGGLLVAAAGEAAVGGGGAAGRTQEAPEAPIPLVPGFAPDGDLAEWRGGPAPRALPAADGRPQVLVWIGQVEGGLAVAAEIRVTARDRGPVTLEVGLADGSPPALPPIGWGHQFGFEVLPDSGACARVVDAARPEGKACREWYARERAARDRLLALFERRWRLEVREGASPVVREVRARPAFDALPPPRARAWGALEPRDGVSARAAAVAGTDARGVELFLPWDAFPPVRPLELSNVRLRVTRARGADPGAGPAGEPGALPARVDAPAGTPAAGVWTRRRLARPLSPALGACGMGPASVVLAGPPDRLPRLLSDSAVAYMRPRAPASLERLVLLDNEARGYQYEPDPTLVSPAAYVVEYPSLRVGPDEWLCGPVLAYRARDRTSPSVDSTRTAGPTPPRGVPFVDLRHVETRREADGGLLVREGPAVRWSHYGSGQCGACPRVSLRVWRIAPGSVRIAPLFEYGEVAEPGGREVEIEMSADWDAITVFESSVDWEAEPPATTWRAMRYCRDPEDPAASYAVCEERKDVPEPPVRLRRAYAEPDARGGGPAGAREPPAR